MARWMRFCRGPWSSDPGHRSTPRAVVGKCRKVVAVDISPVMRERLRQKLVQAELDNVEIAAAGFLT